MHSVARVGWLLAMALVFPLATAAAPQAVQDTLRLESFTSKVLGNTRTLRVLLPPSYDEPSYRTRVYPVLYLDDGQNLSTRRGGTGSTPEIIVVGIDHAGRRALSRIYVDDAHILRERLV